MTRPKIPRCIYCKPCTCYFKPRGIPLSALEEISLSQDEFDSLKLYDLDGIDQSLSCKKIGVSQPTFARILASARKKVADAIINGKAIKIR